MMEFYESIDITLVTSFSILLLWNVVIISAYIAYKREKNVPIAHIHIPSLKILMNPYQKQMSLLQTKRFIPNFDPLENGKYRLGWHDLTVHRASDEIFIQIQPDNVEVGQSEAIQRIILHLEKDNS